MEEKISVSCEFYDGGAVDCVGRITERSSIRLSSEGHCWDCVGGSAGAYTIHRFAEVKFRYCEWEFEEIIRGARALEEFAVCFLESWGPVDCERFLPVVYLDRPEKWNKIGDVIRMGVRYENP